MSWPLLSSSAVGFRIVLPLLWIVDLVVIIVVTPRFCFVVFVLSLLFLLLSWLSSWLSWLLSQWSSVFAVGRCLAVGLVFSRSDSVVFRVFNGK